MFDDDNSSGPWFSGDDMPNPDHPNVITMEFIRDKALVLFGEFLQRQSGIKQNLDEAGLEEKKHFLSIEETEQIVRDHAAMDNGHMMAVGGNTKAEAMQKVHTLLAALCHRIMSNLIAEGARRDLIDVAFDDEHDCFAFQVSDKGIEYVKQNTEFFDEPMDS
ncbi:hypothetical protein EBZ39_00060 [bacterium]|nr:hypothetical protein [bacterium]